MIRSVTVGEVMSSDLITTHPQTTLHEAVSVMLRHRVSGLPVVDDDGSLLGMLTEQDCLRAAYRSVYYQAPDPTVANAMTSNPQCTAPEVDIMVAIEIFLNAPFRRLPVMVDGRLVGLLSRRDALRALGEST
jgi:CBS domain-containing protein